MFPQQDFKAITDLQRFSGLGRLHHSSECHLNHSSWESSEKAGNVTITSSLWKPKQKRQTPHFGLVFEGKRIFCLEFPPQKKNTCFCGCETKTKRTASEYGKGPPTMSRVWRRTWHFKVRGFGHLQGQNQRKKPSIFSFNHRKPLFFGTHLLRHSVLRCTAFFVMMNFVSQVTSITASFSFQRLKEAAWFMDDGFAHPFIVSWSNIKNCEMREQCQGVQLEKKYTWYKRGEWSSPFNFVMTDTSRLHIHQNSWKAPAPNLYQKHSGIPGVWKKLWRSHPWLLCRVFPLNLQSGTFCGSLP